MPSGGQNWRKSIENENSRCPWKRGVSGEWGMLIPHPISHHIWGDATICWRGLSRLLRVSGFRQQLHFRPHELWVGGTFWRKPRGLLTLSTWGDGKRDGWCCTWSSWAKGALQAWVIGIWNAPTLEGNDCCLAGYSSAIFAPFFFAAGPQKAGRSGEGATERGRTKHRKVCKPEVTGTLIKIQDQEDYHTVTSIWRFNDVLCFFEYIIQWRASKYKQKLKDEKPFDPSCSRTFNCNWSNDKSLGCFLVDFQWPTPDNYGVEHFGSSSRLKFNITWK